MNKKDWPGGPAMLAVNIDDVEFLTFPLLGQPKLNGIRACWDGEHLISRQRKVWKEETLPHIYEQLKRFSNTYPGCCLDGELYCHGMPFQNIAAVVAVNRIGAHPDVDRISYHAFDIISDDHTESRQITLSNIYKPWTAVCKVSSLKEVDVWTNRFVEAGFEGLMLRSYSCPYIHGRTEALIKVKPWKFGKGFVIGFKEGLGKYKNMLGALEVKGMNNKTFFVSGGLTDADRISLWNSRGLTFVRAVVYKYRELSKAGIPLQPQLVKIS